MSTEEVVGSGESFSDDNLVASFEPPKTLKLSEVDRLALELAKSKKHVSLAEAKTALANNEKSDLEYKYVVLQIYMKYGLTAADALNENGDIVYGGAAQANAQQS